MPLPPALLLTSLLGQTPVAPPAPAAVEAAAAEPARPNIIARGDWDEAPPKLTGVSRYRGSLRKQLEWIVVHHSSFVEPPGPVGLVQYHRQVYGWADVGYHFIIASDGQVFAGRDIRAMGAHAGQTREANRWVVAIRKGRAEGSVDQARRLDPDWGAIGIVLDGYFDWHFLPSAAQIEALTWLLAELRRRYGIAAQNVITHREVRARIVEARGRTFVGESTLCPGSGLQQVVEAWRQAERETRSAR